MHLADVVHADVPFVAGAAEDVGEAADRVVAFEDQHATPAVASEQRRGGEAADARADDDGIVRLTYGVALIGLGNPPRRHVDFRSNRRTTVEGRNLRELPRGRSQLWETPVVI